MSRCGARLVWIQWWPYGTNRNICDVIRGQMSVYALAFLIGVVAGLRSMTAPAVVSWAARLGWLHLENTWLAFLGAAITPYILSLAALGELINTKLPKTPSRKTPVPF